MLFKVLTREGKGTHQNFDYPLPTAKRPGKWTEPVNPKTCVSGYHIVHRVTPWLPSDLFDIYTAEGRGGIDCAVDKVAFESIRLLEKVTPEWPLLPLYPEVRAALMKCWKMENPKATKWPTWANLSRANLSRADLSGANLSRADLSWANLSRAYLSGAYLSRANLSRANLSGADLSGAYLSGADLAGANLSRAYLSGAYLSGAYLSGANLSGADLSGAYIGISTSVSLPKQYRVDKRGFVEFVPESERK